jgi:hypothetical protein
MPSVLWPKGLPIEALQSANSGSSRYLRALRLPDIHRWQTSQVVMPMTAQ